VLDAGVTTNYTTNSVNAYTNISGGDILPPSQNPDYDPNGNMLTGPVGTDAAVLTYDNDHARRLVGRAEFAEQSPVRGDFSLLGKNHQNRLRTITQNGTTTGYTYDALSRCIESFSNIATDNRERYTWSGWTLLNLELFTNSTPTSSFRYTWGLDLSESLEGAGGVGGLLAIERIVGSNTDIRFPHYDANGNIIALTDNSGNVSARYRYDAFGKILSATDLDSSNWVNHNIHRFSTKPTFGNTNLLYYGYRFYTPITGRWINRDPIEEAGGVNMYGFVGNDGVNRFDSLGLIGVEINIKSQLGGKGEGFSVHWSEKTRIAGYCKQWGLTPWGTGCISYEPDRIFWAYKTDNIDFEVNGYGEASIWIDCNEQKVKEGHPAKITGLVTKMRNIVVGRFTIDKEETLESPTLSIGQEEWKIDGDKKSVQIPWSMWATVKIKGSFGLKSVETDPIQNLGFVNGDTKQAIIKTSGVIHYSCCKKT
jgi:RHS repeat-associated protein